MFRQTWAWFILVAIPVAASVQASSPKSAELAPSQRERKLWKTTIRSAEFSEVPRTSAREACADTQPPVAITTPKPLLGPSFVGGDVKISFIVGTDGRVHSPLMLTSAGSAGDRNVLQTVRGWRYRPATCNGIPTEAEGRIDFSRR